MLFQQPSWKVPLNVMVRLTSLTLHSAQTKPTILMVNIFIYDNLEYLTLANVSLNKVGERRLSTTTIGLSLGLIKAYLK